MDGAGSTRRAEEASAAVVGTSASLTVVVNDPLTTVHLPPERAVITTPALIGLMERCIMAAEIEVASADGGVAWQSASAEIRHRAGLRRGESVLIRAELSESTGDEARWTVTASAPDGRLIGEGTVVRRRVG